MSDLHRDVCEFDLPPPPEGAEVLVIAGDVSERLTDNVLPWIAAQQLAIPVIYVPGNHDFYQTEILAETAYAEVLAAELGVHLLSTGQSVVISGVRFVGATLWTDYAVFETEFASAVAATRTMNDHRLIGHGKFSDRFFPIHATDLHGQQLAAIEAVLAVEFDGPTIVVTHHAPHPKSLRHGLATEPLDASYASDLTAVIEKWNPTVWVHGHVHVSRDYVVAGTRIVCNPRGYITERRYRDPNLNSWDVENPEFNPTLLTEI